MHQKISVVILETELGPALSVQNGKLVKMPQTTKQMLAGMRAD